MIFVATWERARAGAYTTIAMYRTIWRVKQAEARSLTDLWNLSSRYS